MSTYDHRQVLSDYEKGKITPDMAVGHGLQHIDLLYKAQAATRSELEALKTRVNTHQTALDRLMAFMEKVLRKPKKPASPNQPRPTNS
ncbi:MAG: hypothetical protein U0350_34220 [Caldilineaceae bacterium]